MTDWISVLDKLPPVYDFVLVFANNLGSGEPKPISIARIDISGSWEFMGDVEKFGAVGAYMDIEYEMDEYQITHWMPLPKTLEEI
jgi:hypothetical protein